MNHFIIHVVLSAPKEPDCLQSKLSTQNSGEAAPKNIPWGPLLPTGPWPCSLLLLLLIEESVLNTPYSVPTSIIAHHSLVNTANTPACRTLLRIRCGDDRSPQDRTWPWWWTPCRRDRQEHIRTPQERSQTP